MNTTKKTEALATTMNHIAHNTADTVVAEFAANIAHDLNSIAAKDNTERRLTAYHGQMNHLAKNANDAAIRDFAAAAADDVERILSW